MEPVVRVRDLRMRYGSNDVLTGVDFDVAAGQVVCMLGPNGAGKTTTIEILEGFRIRSAGEVSVLGQDPAHADEDWRARTGVVLQSWRDHPRWTPRKLLTQLGGYFEPYSTPERRRPHDIDRAPGDGGVDRPRRPQDRHLLGWPAETARRGGRDRRAPRAAVPRRAHGRLRPPGPPPVPWAGPQARRHRGNHDPAHDTRPRRGREAGRSGARACGREDRRRRHRRRLVAAARGGDAGAVDHSPARATASRCAMRRRSCGPCSRSSATRSRTSRCVAPASRTHILLSSSSTRPATVRRRPNFSRT